VTAGADGRQLDGHLDQPLEIARVDVLAAMRHE